MNKNIAKIKVIFALSTNLSQNSNLAKPPTQNVLNVKTT